MTTGLDELESQLLAAQTSALDAFDALIDLRERFAEIVATDEVFEPLMRVRGMLPEETDGTLRMLQAVNEMAQRYLDVLRAALSE